MVHIFFIISSYALSYKLLKQIHSQQFSALDTTLSSAVFRRAIRLFLPSFVILFLMALALHCELSDERYASSFLALSSQLTHCWQTCWGLLRSLWAIDDIGYPQPLCNPALWIRSIITALYCHSRPIPMSHPHPRFPSSQHHSCLFLQRTIIYC
jgi:peptidoglycan/LPS O-acetylase OafA/YrhL